MPSHHPKVEHVHVGRAGWFAIGALTAGIAFIALLVAGDLFEAAHGALDAKAGTPALVIEGN